MASVADAMASLAAAINAILAPYQPNLPGYPNASSFAGKIPATLIAPGQAIQVKMLVRLENHMAQVDVYEGRITKPMPFVTQGTPPLVSVGGGRFVGSQEATREEKELIVRIWAESHPAREEIASIIRAGLGDATRQTESDGTITVVRYMTERSFDSEEKDSIYVKQLHYMADITGVQTVEFWTIDETITTTIVDDQTPVVTEYP